MSDLQYVQESVSDHMDEILALFKSGAKICVLVRTPHHPDRDFMMTNDHLDELAAMIQRRKDALKSPG